MSRLGQTIPALPVRDAAASVDFYRDRLGFEVLHHDGGFAVLKRDDAVVHLWEASDESWRKGVDLQRPIDSGAESFIAGTASCRISVEGVEDRKSTRLNSSHQIISYAVFCLKKKKKLKSDRCDRTESNFR